MSKSFHHNGEETGDRLMREAQIAERGAVEARRRENWTQAQNLRAKARRLRARARATH
jgi:hypothetical protein